MPTQFGITYEIIEVDNPGTFTVKADGANTTVEAVLITQNIKIYIM